LSYVTLQERCPIPHAVPVRSLAGCIVAILLKGDSNHAAPDRFRQVHGRGAAPAAEVQDEGVLPDLGETG
jgi:hypothetical protein